METVVSTFPPPVPSQTIGDPDSDGHGTTITLGFLSPLLVSFQPTDDSGGALINTGIESPSRYTISMPMGASTVANSYSINLVLILTNTLSLLVATSTMPQNLALSLLLTTLTDDAGRPTATQVLAIMATPSLSFTTLINTADQPTATQLLTIMPTPSISEETTSTSQSSLIATIESNPTPSGIHTVVYHISQKEYFVGMFLPTIVASIIAICVRILSTNATIFQPWHALTHDRGASGRDSLCLQTGGWQSVVTSIQSLWRGQVVIFFTSLLLLFSVVLIPVSAEAVILDLRRDGCERGATTAKNCAWVLSTSAPASKAAIPLLVLMSIIILALLFFLGRWRLGVHTNPWGICTLASLSLDEEIRQLVAVVEELPRGRDRRFLEALRFKLGHFQHINGEREYGLIALDDLDGTESRSPQKTKVTVALENKSHNQQLSNTQHGIPFFFLSCFGRLMLLGFVCGVLILILYYSQTGGDTAFERFLDEDSFGVRFLFTSFGVVTSFFWDSFYSSITVATQYQLLATQPQSATRSILLAPPTNAFSGFWYAARTRSGFLATAGLASVLSEFLGIFLSNVSFQVTQTFLVSQISIWTSVGILSFMVLVIVISFYVKWPHMPADPSTIAGAIYYIHNSSMPGRFEGLGTLNRKERDQKVTELALLYELGTIKSVLGAPTVSVDICNKG
ncbi:hypothetical protein NUW58_g1814 [Xylaria curta]|uniref:Uncharacterized protein n=1 Tax=Xylaria curta TaxID=42375 RepID=A0ACC1PL23_9PEZI|nr:hypothetical protein NUW58_g1814 [Xylaria curta]